MSEIQYGRITYWAGMKYQLLATYQHKVDLPDAIGNDWVFIKDGILHIEKGYCWNGASGPTIDSKNTMRGSLVHDALYQLIRIEVLAYDFRKDADELLRDIMREDGMTKFRSWIWYKSVRKGAKDSALPESIREEHSAP